MNTSVLSAAVISAALVASAYLMASRPAPTLSLAPTTPTLSTSAEGRVSVTPDIVVLSLSAQARASTSREAYAKMTTEMTSLKDLLKSSGVEMKDIQTTSISLSPEYDYSNGTPKANGFLATENLSVKVRKLDSANDILDKASAITGVQIGSISYDLDKKDGVYAEARKLALEKARAKADEMAKTTGVKITKVQSISEGQSSVAPYPPMYQTMKAMDSVGGANTEIAAGQLDYTIVVNVAYEIQ